jgi:hypothetical protein
MATIKARRQVNGSIRYTAIVRRRVGKTIVHREAKTFTHRAAALSWARHREVELENPAALIRKQHGAVRLAELIRWYIDTFETIAKWQRSKQTHLEFLERHSIGKANALTLTSAVLIDHVRSRRGDGAGPATVINDLIWIGVVLRAAKNVKELPVRPEITQEAQDARNLTVESARWQSSGPEAKRHAPHPSMRSQAGRLAGRAHVLTCDPKSPEIQATLVQTAAERLSCHFLRICAETP